VAHLFMGVSNLKKFLINIAIFFAILVVVDFSLGKIFHFIQARAGGRTGTEYYVCERASEDVIIMGSSRASHHYVPEIITEKTGMSCFNAGQDGNGIILQYGRWKMLSERYSPKLLIYDVNPDFDLCKNDNMTYVDRLKPFCSNADVRHYVTGMYHMEELKLFSQMYRYNYKIIEMTSDCVKNGEDKLKGYIPLVGEIRKEVVDAPRLINKTTIDYDEIKNYYLEQLAKECKDKGTELVFVASPSFRGGGYGIEAFDAVRKIAEKYDLPFLYYYESEYSENPKIFKDSQHLNDEGAHMFTEDMASRISL